MVTIELKGDDCELTLEVESSNSEDVITCCKDPADEDISIFIAKGQASKLVAFAEAVKKYLPSTPLQQKSPHEPEA